MTLPPCHYSFQVYTRELREDEKIDLLPEKKNWDDYDTLTFKEKIEKGPQRAISLMFNCRSQDVPLGTPFNIASYALLLNFIAKVVNMVPEEIIGNFGDCHIYSNQINGLKEQLDRKPYKLPSLILNTEFWPNNMENGDPVGFSENVGHIIENLEIDDFILDNYISHPNQF
jgi:thymidylate synthase